MIEIKDDIGKGSGNDERVAECGHVDIGLGSEHEIGSIKPDQTSGELDGVACQDVDIASAKEIEVV